MSVNYIDIYPHRHPNTDYDASDSVLIRKRDGALIEINASAMLIWHLCDGTQSIEDITNVVCDSYGLNSDDAIESIVPLLQYLHDQQCLLLQQRRPCFTAPPIPPVVNFFPLSTELLETLEEYRRVCEPLFPEGIKPDDSELSETMLEQLIDSSVALSQKNLAFSDPRLNNNQALNPLLEIITQQLHELVPVNIAKLFNSGHALYGAGGSMGWHTNEDKPGLRIYCSWAEKAGTNYFRYRDPDSGEIITLPEPQGWTVKSFYIPPRPRQLWHCLYAGSRRIAIGFADFEFKLIDRIIDN